MTSAKVHGFTSISDHWSLRIEWTNLVRYIVNEIRNCIVATSCHRRLSTPVPLNCSIQLFYSIHPPPPPQLKLRLARAPSINSQSIGCRKTLENQQSILFRQVKWRKRLHRKFGRLDKLGFQPETIVIVIDIVSESCFSKYVSPTIIFDQ